MKRNKPIHILLPLFTVVILMLILYPLGNLFYLGISNLKSEFTQARPLVTLVGFTYGQAFLSSFCAALLGCPLALLFSEFSFPGKKIGWSLCTLSFSMPTLVMILALVGVWGKTGWLGSYLGDAGFYGWWAILLAHTLFNFPLFMKMVGQALIEMDRTEEKIALSLGQGRMACFWEVSIRKLLPAFRSAFILSFLYCSSSLVVLLLLGGNPSFSTLEVGIFQAIKVDLDIPTAALYALIQLSVCFVIQGFRGKLRPTVMASQARSPLRLYHFHTPLLNSAVIVLALFAFFVLVALPFIQLVGSGLISIGKLEGSELIAHLVTGVWLALRAGVLSVLLGFAAAYAERHLHSHWGKRLISFLCELPVALSAMILGLALILSYPFLYTHLRLGLWGAVFIQVILSLPLVFRTLRDGFFRIERELEWSAQSLGAGHWGRLFYVELPLMRRSVVNAFILSVGLSLGEVGSLLLFESQAHTPLSLWLYRLMGTYRFEEAQGVAVILLLMMSFLFWVVGKWENGKTENH